MVDADRRDTESFHLLAEHHPILLSQKSVDYNAIPMFSEMDVSMGSALKNALWDVGLLALLNILLFMAVYISFLRYDVR